MTNKRIAQALKETASLIELTGGNAFRARAFSNAARTLERMDEPVIERVAAGTLQQVHGIGTGLAAQIRELIEQDTFPLRDELLATVPPGVLEMLRVKGLGAKKVRQLWQELDITSLDELEHAAAAGRLAELSGFGAKTQEKVLSALALLRQYGQRRRYVEALALALPVLDQLRTHEALARAEPAGALRRQMETVAAAEFVVAAPDAAAGAQALSALLSLERAEEAAQPVLQGTLAGDFPLRIYVTTPERFGTVWWQRTGSEAHCAAFAAAYGAPGLYADEAALYAAAGLPVIPPELREHRGELAAAAAGALPRLITLKDLQGSLHNHSTYSDGAHPLREMAEAARAMGLSYFGICDHSRSLSIANGMPVERVRAQQEEIRRLNEAFAQAGGPPFRIFSGIESDILSDGALDYPDDVLASFDFVVASVHVGLGMTEGEATRRVLRAVENPYTTILGHATGRLLLAREGYPLDHARVIAACAEHGVAIELNANPRRLDMDWRWLRMATQQNVMIAINPDAHATEGLHDVAWGLRVARKGWLTAEQCLNALPLEAFTQWLDTRRAERIA